MTTGFINQDNSDTEGSAITAAQKQYKMRNYEEALRLFQSAGLNSNTCVDIGSCYYMLNGHKEALEYWQKAINLDSKNYKAYANIGNLHYKNHQVEMAISFWLAALITQPEDSQTCLNLAVAFEKKQMRFESIKYFEKYIKYAADKHNDEYLKIRNRIQNCFNVANQYLTHGVKFQSEGNNEKAAACYFKALSNYPNLSKVNLNLGSIFFADKNLNLAIKYWKVASHIDPSYGKIYSNLAISYDLLKNFDYAYAYYNIYMNYIINQKEEYGKCNQRLLKIKPFLNRNPNLIEVHLEKAKKHLANNEIFDAIDEFRVYSILKPEVKQEYKDKIQKLESYINPEANIIMSCFKMGNQLYAQKKFVEAKHYFWRVMNLSSRELLEYSKARAKYSQCEKGQVSEANAF